MTAAKGASDVGSASVFHGRSFHGLRSHGAGHRLAESNPSHIASSRTHHCRRAGSGYAADFFMFLLLSLGVAPSTPGRFCWWTLLAHHATRHAASRFCLCALRPRSPISCRIALRPLDGVGALVWCNGEPQMRKAVIVLIATVALAFDVGLIVALKITNSAQNTSMTPPAVDTFGLTQARALPD